MVGAIAAAVVVSVVPLAAGPSANAAPAREAGPQASPGCVDRQDLAGGRWLTTTLCTYNEVTGYSQVVEREIWLDRTMNLGGGWDGRLGLYTDSYYSAHQARGNYYWRTCIRDNGGAIYCGRWYNQ
jgi:hypothetical protein